MISGQDEIIGYIDVKFERYEATERKVGELGAYSLRHQYLQSSLEYFECQPCLIVWGQNDYVWSRFFQ